MEKDETKELFNKLRDFFPANVIKWRAVATFEDKSNNLKAIAYPFVDARVIMDRLDDLLGPENWQVMYSTLTTGHLVCRIGIRIDNEWIWKEDGGGSSLDIDDIDDSTNAKPTRDSDSSARGDFTNAFKRCIQGAWGVGRYLYLVEKPTVPAEKKGRSAKLSVTPSLPAKYLPTGSQPTTRESKPAQKSTTKDDKKNSPPAGKKEETPSPPEEKKEETSSSSEEKKTETLPPEDKNLIKALGYKIPVGLPFEKKTLEDARHDPFLGPIVIGYLAGKRVHPSKGDLYAPLNPDEVKLHKAAEYVWNKFYANMENQKPDASTSE